MLLYIVSYDVSCNKRRKKVSDLLEGYGKRVQYSVFECMLPPRKYEELKQRLMGRINIKEDSIRIYPVSGHTLPKVEIWGGVPLTEMQGSTII